MSVYCNRQVFNPHLHQNCQWSMTWKVIGLDTSTVWMTCVHFYWLEDGKKDEVPMVLAQIMMMSSIFWRWLSKYTKYYLSKCFNAKTLQCETKNIKQKIGTTYQPPPPTGTCRLLVVLGHFPEFAMGIIIEGDPKISHRVIGRTQLFNGLKHCSENDIHYIKWLVR